MISKMHGICRNRSAYRSILAGGDNFSAHNPEPVLVVNGLWCAPEYLCSGSQSGTIVLTKLHHPLLPIAQFSQTSAFRRATSSRRMAALSAPTGSRFRALSHSSTWIWPTPIGARRPYSFPSLSGLSVGEPPHPTNDPGRADVVAEGWPPKAGLVISIKSAHRQQ